MSHILRNSSKSTDNLDRLEYVVQYLHFQRVSVSLERLTCLCCHVHLANVDVSSGHPVSEALPCGGKLLAGCTPGSIATMGKECTRYDYLGKVSKSCGLALSAQQILTK